MYFWQGEKSGRQWTEKPVDLKKRKKREGKKKGKEGEGREGERRNIFSLFFFGMKTNIMSPM